MSKETQLFTEVPEVIKATGSPTVRPTSLSSRLSGTAKEPKANENQLRVEGNPELSKLADEINDLKDKITKDKSTLDNRTDKISNAVANVFMTKDEITSINIIGLKTNGVQVVDTTKFTGFADENKIPNQFIDRFKVNRTITMKEKTDEEISDFINQLDKIDSTLFDRYFTSSSKYVPVDRKTFYSLPQNVQQLVGQARRSVKKL